MRLNERIAIALTTQASRWLVRVLALLVALFAVPTAFFFLSLPGGGTGGLVLVLAYALGLVGAMPAIVLLGIPGLILFDLLRWRGLIPVLALGALVGGVGGAVSVAMVGETGLGFRIFGWIMAIPLGIGFGELGAVSYWASSRWVEKWIRDVGEEAALRASLTPEERTLFASRLDRDPW